MYQPLTSVKIEVVVKVGLENLTELERKTYEVIKRGGEIRPKNLPDPRMIGAVSNLKVKGFVETLHDHRGSG